MVVSKKVLKSAVGRNRIRRRVYEVVRLEMPKITGTYDIALLVFSSEVVSLPHDELTVVIRDLFRSANLYK